MYFFELTTQQKERGAFTWCRKAKKGPIHVPLKGTSEDLSRWYPLMAVKLGKEVATS